MKSSMTTRSGLPAGRPFVSTTPAPSAKFPLEMRTRDTTLNWKSTLRNENVWLPAVLGTAKPPNMPPIGTPDGPKNCIVVWSGRSTSLKTAPKPRTKAGVVVPGMKKVTSTAVDPIAVKRRWGLNGSNVPGYVGSMLPNSIAVLVGLTALALTSTPVPGVEKTTPRGLLTLKKSAGRRFGAAAESGTPSQLISRRAPVASLNRPLAPAIVPPPKSTRKASRNGVMPAAVKPLPEWMISANDGAATARAARPAASSTVMRDVKRKAYMIRDARRPVAIDYDGTITEPLRLSKLAKDLDDGKYAKSWYELPGRDDQRPSPLVRPVGADLLEPVPEAGLARGSSVAIGIAGAGDRASGAHDGPIQPDSMAHGPTVDVESERPDLLRGAPAEYDSAQ